MRDVLRAIDLLAIGILKVRAPVYGVMVPQVRNSQRTDPAKMLLMLLVMVVAGFEVIWTTKEKRRFLY